MYYIIAPKFSNKLNGLANSDLAHKHPRSLIKMFECTGQVDSHAIFQIYASAPLYLKCWYVCSTRKLAQTYTNKLKSAGLHPTFFPLITSAKKSASAVFSLKVIKQLNWWSRLNFPTTELLFCPTVWRIHSIQILCIIVSARFI